MRLLRLISRLRAVLRANEDENVAVVATLEGAGSGPAEVRIISLRLAEVLFAPTANTVILHFAAIATTKKSLDFATKIQAAINAGEVEVIEGAGTLDANDGLEEGLPF